MNTLQGKTNNLELRSAVQSKDYTIITYQRPLKGSDVYDKHIYLNRSQAIIWALGPLNDRNEVSYHPIYLKNDHFIDFGRAAKWNCPLTDKAAMQASDQKTGNVNNLNRGDLIFFSNR